MTIEKQLMLSESRTNPKWWIINPQKKKEYLSESSISSQVGKDCAPSIPISLSLPRFGMSRAWELFVTRTTRKTNHAPPVTAETLVFFIFIGYWLLICIYDKLLLNH